jgi:drug/metabolite transporter (DMT)-like permease
VEADDRGIRGDPAHQAKDDAMASMISALRRLLARTTGPHLAVLAVVATTLIWGTSSVATKAALAEVPPITLAFVRLAVASLALAPLVRRSGARPTRGRGPALLGLSGFAGFVLLRNVGLGSAPASHASLIEAGATPVLAALLAVALLGERPTARYLYGLLAALVGVALTVVPGREGAAAASLLGDGLLLAGTACFAAYTVLGRGACAGGGSLAVVAGGMRYGLLALAPFAVGELAIRGVPALSLGTVLVLIYLGAGCSAVAHALWSYGLSRLPAGQVALLGNLELLVGVALAGLLGEAFTPVQVLGGALIVVGLWLATTRRRVRFVGRHGRTARAIGAAARCSVSLVWRDTLPGRSPRWAPRRHG